MTNDQAPMTNDKNGRLIENARVKLVSAILAAVFVCGLVAEQIAFKLAIHYRLNRIEETLTRVDAKIDEHLGQSWDGQKMRTWIAETEAENASWNGAAVE